jgi:hypothetical protein
MELLADATAADDGILGRPPAGRQYCRACPLICLSGVRVSNNSRAQRALAETAIWIIGARVGSEPFGTIGRFMRRFGQLRRNDPG